MLTLAGCDDGGGSGEVVIDTVTPDTTLRDTTSPADTATADEAEPVDEFTAFIARYDLLDTVAGRGERREKDVNNWASSFEGGPATAAELSRPHIAMADAAANIYIADKDAHAVRAVAPDGTITTVAGTNEPGDDGDTPGLAHERRLSSPNGLWVHGDGTLYILDLGNGKVRKRDTTGKLTTLFAVSGGISTGRGLWVAADESLVYLSAGTRVLRWRPTSGVDTFAEGLSSLGNLVVDPAGQLVVADRGANRVYRLDAAGARTPIAGNGTDAGGGEGRPALDTGLAGVRGVWFVDTGGYLLATHEGSQVWYVDSAGLIHLFLNGRDDHSHTGDGQFFRSPGYKISEARAVTLDLAGNVLITENDHGYVRIVKRRP